MNLRNIHTIFPPLAGMLLALLLGACNDNPTTIGDDYIPNNVEFTTYTLKPEEIEVMSDIAAVSNSSSNGSVAVLVGRDDDGTIANGLLSVTETSPLFKDAARQITKVELQLRSINYRSTRDSGRDISFDVVALDSTFGPNEQWSDQIASRIESAPVIGSFSGNYPDSTVIRFELDLAAATSFLRNYYEIRPNSTTPSDTVFIVKTLALRSRAGNRRIVSFLGATSTASFDTLRPTLKVTFADTNHTVRAGVSNWVVKYPASVPIGSGNITLAGGAPIRTLLKLRLDSIPPTATIHQTKLTLRIDTARSRYGSFGATTRMVGYLGDVATLNQSTYLANTKLRLTGYRIAQDSVSFTDEFRYIGMAPTITEWLQAIRGTGGSANYGLVLGLDRGVLSSDVEATSVDRLIFFGNDAADPSLRPTVTITYSTQTSR